MRLLLSVMETDLKKVTVRKVLNYPERSLSIAATGEYYSKRVWGAGQIIVGWIIDLHFLRFVFLLSPQKNRSALNTTVF